jgi:hypothetical protein
MKSWRVALPRPGWGSFAQPANPGRLHGVHKMGGWVGRASHHSEASPLPVAPVDKPVPSVTSVHPYS